MCWPDDTTSVLAILALAGGRLYGSSWLDPIMSIVGAVVVALWAKTLIGQTSKVHNSNLLAARSHSRWLSRPAMPTRMMD